MSQTRGLTISCKITYTDCKIMKFRIRLIQTLLTNNDSVTAQHYFCYDLYSSDKVIIIVTFI